MSIMGNNNNEKGGIIAIVVSVIIVVLILGSCGDSSDEYRETLESGQKKYYSGEEMTREEYNAVKGFNDWKSKQGEKKYSDWDD